jgi:casein kinase II subunit beta
MSNFIQKNTFREPFLQPRREMSRERSMAWVDWFINVDPRGKYFVRIDNAYIRDVFNMYGFRNRIGGRSFKMALETMRGAYTEPRNRPRDWPEDADELAVRLYGLLHARYLLTKAGCQQMHDKYMNDDFSPCPRTFCKGIRCLPCGVSENQEGSPLLMYCPRCKEIYADQTDMCNMIDGAYFGPSWIHMFLQEFSEIVPKTALLKPPIRLFGFKIETDDDEVNEC